MFEDSSLPEYNADSTGYHYQRFEGACCLYLQGLNSQSTTPEQVTKKSM
jgi:hypothetical protein